MRQLKTISKDVDGIHLHDCTCALCWQDYFGTMPNSHWCSDQHRKQAHRIGLQFNPLLNQTLKNKSMQEKTRIILTDHEVRIQRLEGNKENQMNLPAPGLALENKLDLTHPIIQERIAELAKKEQSLAEDRKALLQATEDCNAEKKKYLELNKKHESYFGALDMLYEAVLNDGKIRATTLQWVFKIPFTEKYVTVPGYTFERVFMYHNLYTITNKK